MRKIGFFIIVCIVLGCDNNSDIMNKIIFLHHSTGQAIWIGETNRYVRKLLGKNDVTKFFNESNKKNKTNYRIVEQSFPKVSPYGWRNNPYDYYNIWVKNAGHKPYKEEPTLEILTKEYGTIVFKHCYPVSKIMEDTGMPDINSDEKRLENYKLQYEALKNKMHEFPENKFIVWTPPVHVRNKLSLAEAERTRTFYLWLINEWDDEGDNIYLWDFYSYETEGELFMQDKYARNENDSHPGKEFAGRMAVLFGQFVIDVLEGRIQ